MIAKLGESKTVVFALILCALAIALVMVAALMQAAFKFEIPWVGDVLDFFQITFLGAAGKGAVDNNAAPVMAAIRSGRTDAPPVSKWGTSQPAYQPTVEDIGPQNPYGGG